MADKTNPKPRTPEDIARGVETFEFSDHRPSMEWPQLLFWIAAAAFTVVFWIVVILWAIR